MSEGMWTDEEVIKQRLAAMQEEVGRSGYYSALWKEGDIWHFVASTDAKWLDQHMHVVARADSVVTWVPADQDLEPDDDED